MTDVIYYTYHTLFKEVKSELTLTFVHTLGLNPGLLSEPFQLSVWTFLALYSTLWAPPPMTKGYPPVHLWSLSAARTSHILDWKNCE